MNFKDKDFLTGLGLMGIGLLGIFFPALIKTLFIVILLAGVVSIGYWASKQ